MTAALSYARAQWVKAHGPQSPLEGLRQLDDILAARGWPRLSPWWVNVARRFYAGDPAYKRLVARVGRRGGKSTTVCRILMAEVLYGNHVVPPGDMGVAAILSVSVPDAKDRLKTCREICDALGIRQATLPRATQGNGFRIAGMRRGVLAQAASMRTAVGFTVIFLFADEVSRWLDKQSGANPARHVFGSVRPAMATMPNAKEFMVSAPWSDLDYHHETFTKGTNSTQLCVQAPSWVANPTLTEAYCRTLEPDEQTFLREFGAIPMKSTEDAFFKGDQIDACMRPPHQLERPRPGDMVTAGADLGFTSDHSALALAARRGDITRVFDVLTLEPTPDRPLIPSSVIGRFADEVRAVGHRSLMADGHYREAVREHLVAHDLELLDAPLDVSQPYVRTRVLMKQGQLLLPHSVELARNLREVTAKPLSSGKLSIRLPRRAGGGHCDDVSALVLAASQELGTYIDDAPPPANPDPDERRMVEELEATRFENQGFCDDWGLTG